MGAHEGKKSQLGQFFTTNEDVQAVISRMLTIRQGRALEPSAGAGHLVRILERRSRVDVTAVEYDDTIPRVCDSQITYMDFFVYAANTTERFRAIVGNPPYVAWKNVEPATRLSSQETKSRYSDKTNLYHLFIDECMSLLQTKGELVFIVPKEWLYTTSAAPLRERMSREGAITHIVDCGEAKLFTDASVPALLIFRYQRGVKQGDVSYATFDEAVDRTSSQRSLVHSGSSWMFLPKPLAEAIQPWGTLADQYDVKVGFVTGLDRAFKVTNGHVEHSVTIDIVTTKKVTERYVDVHHVKSVEDLPTRVRAHLEQEKSALLARRIAQFDESNWWQYGAVRNRKSMESNSTRFFALVKTRSPKPFFSVTGAKYFGGGVLGLFKRKGASVGVKDALTLLNSPRYRAVLEAMSLTSHDKVSLQPATLARAPFPKTKDQLKVFLRP
jgi:adenine-specific DNA-methyltransferase